MSIRPIDIQISIQRSNEYTKEASLQNQKAIINQFTNAREFQQVIDNAQRQVMPTGQIYHKRIDKDHERQRRHFRHAKSYQVKDKEHHQSGLSDEAEMKKGDKGANIDIRV